MSICVNKNVYNYDYDYMHSFHVVDHHVDTHIYERIPRRGDSYALALYMPSYTALLPRLICAEPTSRDRIHYNKSKASERPTYLSIRLFDCETSCSYSESRSQVCVVVSLYSTYVYVCNRARGALIVRIATYCTQF